MIYRPAAHSRIKLWPTRPKLVLILLVVLLPLALVANFRSRFLQLIAGPQSNQAVVRDGVYANGYEQKKVNTGSSNDRSPHNPNIPDVQRGETELNNVEKNQVDKVPSSPNSHSERSEDPVSKPEPPITTSSARIAASCKDDKTALFEKNGTPCVNWKKVVENQHMYTINANGVRYVVCVPPKNGSTYHLGLMFRILGVKGYDSKQTVHFKMEVKDRLFVSNYTEEEIASLFRDVSVPRYAMVRNPLTRTLSGYINKYGRFLEESKRPQAFQQFIRNGLSTANETQRTMVRYPNWSKLNQHFRLQMEFCGFAGKDLKSHFKLFRVEEPEKYVDFVYKIIPERYLKDGWPVKYDKSFREYVLGPRLRTHNTDEIFLDHIGSLEVFDLLAGMVKDDIEYLGYQEDVRKLRQELAAKVSS